MPTTTKEAHFSTEIINSCQIKFKKVLQLKYYVKIKNMLKTLISPTVGMMIAIVI